MMISIKSIIGFLLLLVITVESRRSIHEHASQFLSAPTNGTKWAVLVAGSMEYYNYRHQADVCHAYQIMKNGGLKDENIIVFMYDDIAFNVENPTPGLIVNKPYGSDVYAGVPKDYTGSNTTAHNLFNVLLGNKPGLTGGSGKVLQSGPDDLVFFYYADHGSTGFVCMPTGGYVYANKLNKVLKRMYREKMFNQMVIYIEACESGSMFDGLLPDNINIYATTASNPNESSWAYYCPESFTHQNATPGTPEFYGSCLGDLYSIAWLEDTDASDLNKETLNLQYQTVKTRTNESHVMQYGDMSLSSDFLSTFMGSNPNNTWPKSVNPTTFSIGVDQRDVKLVYLKNKVERAAIGSVERVEAEKRLEEEVSHREQVDTAMDKIVNSLLSNSPNPAFTEEGRPVVDDWDCFNKMVDTYEENCGEMSHYAKKYGAVLAKLCNAGVGIHQFATISTQACPDPDSTN